jgi:hypothetical protein
MSATTLDKKQSGFQLVTEGFRSEERERDEISRAQGFGVYRDRNRRILQTGENALVATGSLPLFAVWQERHRGTSQQAGLGLVAELRFLYKSDRFGLSEKFCHRLVELLTLDSGWDGENARPPKPEVLARMVGIVLLLKREAAVFVEPFLTPTIGGYAQLEWHDHNRALDIEATAQGWAIVGSETGAEGPRVYYEADATPREAYKLIDAYCWFAERRLTWPVI